MTHDVSDTIADLTRNVRNLHEKPLLRHVLEAELLKMKFDEEEVTKALDKTFKVTLQ